MKSLPALRHELDAHMITYAGNGCFQMNVLKPLNVPLYKQKQSCKPTNLARYKHLPSEIPFRGLASHCKHILTHLCLTFHYWNGSDVVVIYFLLRKAFAKSHVSHMHLPPEFTCHHVVQRVSHCCRYWRAGSLSKK